MALYLILLLRREHRGLPLGSDPFAGALPAAEAAEILEQLNLLSGRAADGGAADGRPSLDSGNSSILRSYARVKGVVKEPQEALALLLAS